MRLNSLMRVDRDRMESLDVGTGCRNRAGKWPVTPGVSSGLRSRLKCGVRTGLISRLKSVFNADLNCTFSHSLRPALTSSFR